MGKFTTAIRQGKRFLVTDRDVPVAILSPFVATAISQEELILRSPAPDAPPLGHITVVAVGAKAFNSTEELLVERRRR